MDNYLVDVPVKINIWIRPECQKAQFEVIKKAKPSILFIQSDGGRNDKEWQAIYENRKLIDEGIDWDCKVYRFYEDHNNGMYTMGKKVSQFIWETVDRCVFLEDDHIPSVSFFRFCAEMLEKYKDDERVGLITGYNPFEVYKDALPNDYFFTESGWAIWGIATWKRVVEKREYPLPYANDAYIRRCLKDNAPPFWQKIIEGYCKGELVDGHYPGGEYYNEVNSLLYHTLSIVPTKNMIRCIGENGEHARKTRKTSKYFNIPEYEIEGEIKHPQYMIDDKHYAKMYEKHLGHDINSISHFFWCIWHGIELLFTGRLFKAIKRKLSKKIEK